MTRKVLIPAALLVFIMGCTEPTQGMFYSIEKEKKTGDASNALPNDITVMGAAVRGTVDPEFYVAANSLYRKKGDQDWERISPALPGLSSPRYFDAAALGDRLYLLAGDDSRRGIFASADGNSFTEVSQGGRAGYPASLLPIQGDTGNLLVNWSTGGGFELYSLSSSDTLSAASLKEASSSEVLQAVKSGTAYVAVDRSFAYSGSDFTGLWTKETVVLSGKKADLGGIISTDVLSGAGMEVLASTADGRILRRNGANDWEVYPGTGTLSGSSAALEFTTIIEWSTGFTPGRVLLLGTVQNGYGEAFSKAGPPVTAVLQNTDITVNASSFASSTFSSKSVSEFIIYQNQLYAATLSGLWKYGRGSSSADSTWNWE